MVHEDKARKEFASRLALACENAGYEQHGRQAEIARRMKLTPKAVSKWFNGETIPRREKLRELATLIGTTPTYLLGEDTEESGQVRFYQELNPRQKIIIDLLDELPDSETDELLKTLEEKKQKYNAIYEELARKKNKSLLNQHKSGSVPLRVCASLYPISFFYTQNVLKVLYNNEHKVHHIPTNPPRPTERRAILRVTRQWSGVK